MHAATSDRGGGSGGGSWRLPPDETLQVSTDAKDKLDVSEQINNLLKSLLTVEKKSVIEKCSERATITNEEKWKLNRFFSLFFFFAGSRLWRRTKLEKYSLSLTRNRLCDSRHCNCNLPFRVTYFYF